MVWISGAHGEWALFFMAFIDKYLNFLSLAFVILLAAGFLRFKVLF